MWRRCSFIQCSSSMDRPSSMRSRTAGSRLQMLSWENSFAYVTVMHHYHCYHCFPPPLFLEVEWLTSPAEGGGVCFDDVPLFLLLIVGGNNEQSAASDDNFLRRIHFCYWCCFGAMIPWTAWCPHLPPHDTSNIHDLFNCVAHIIISPSTNEHRRHAVVPWSE